MKYYDFPQWQNRGKEEKLGGKWPFPFEVCLHQDWVLNVWPEWCWPTLTLHLARRRWL